MENKKIIEDSAIYYDSYGNEHNIEDDIEQAEADVEKMKANVNFRWNLSEINRAKKIAKFKGMPYQTYIKSSLKQIMDRDERQMM